MPNVSITLGPPRLQISTKRHKESLRKHPVGLRLMSISFLNWGKENLSLWVTPT